MADDQIDVRIAATIDGLKDGLNQAGSELDQFKGHAESTGHEAGSSFEIMGEKATGLRHILEGLSNPISGLYNDVKELAEAFLVAFAVEKIAEWAHSIAEAGAEVLHMSEELGMATEDVSAFNYAAGAMGISAESADMGLIRLERTMGKASAGSKTAKAEFAAMGISLKDAEGHAKSADQVLNEVADSFSRHADGYEKTTLAMELMGRAGAKMIPILDEGSAGLEHQREAAERTGTVLSGPMAEGMEQTALKFHELGAAAEGVGITLFDDLKPSIDAILSGVIDLIEGFNNWLRNNEAVTAAFKALGTVISSIVDLVRVLFNAIGDIVEAFTRSNSKMGEAESNTKQLAELIEYLANMFRVLADAVAIAVEFIVGAIMPVITAIEGIGEAIWAVIHGDLPALADAFSGTMSKMASDAQSTAAKIKSSFADMQSTIANTYKIGDDKYDPHALDQIMGKSGGGKPAFHLPSEAGKEKKPKKPKDLTQKLEDEELQAAEKEALEEIKIKENENNSLYALGQRSLNDMVAMQKKLEEDKYQVTLQYYQKKAQADAKDKVAHLKDLDAIKLLEIQHREAVAKIDESYAAKKKQQADKERDDFIKDEEYQLQEEFKTLDQREKLGQISANKKRDLELQLTATVRHELLARIDAELATLTKGTDAYRVAYEKRMEIIRKFSAMEQQINAKALDAEIQKWTSFSKTISNGFNQAINGMVLGTENWRQALGQIIDGVANAFLQMGEKVLEDWIKTHILKIAISKTSSATESSSEIAAAAGRAAANAYASTAAIPIVGPAMAPGAAAMALADVMSFESLAFAEQGMLLDRDRLVFAHKDEQILPAHISKGMQQLIMNGGNKSGDASLNYSPTINAPAAKSLDQLLHEESSTMLRWVQRAYRDGKLGNH